MRKIGKTIIKAHYVCDENDPFQTQWLVKVMNKAEFNYTEMAEALDVSRQTLYSWLYSRTKMTYIAVYAICMMFDTKDDPNHIFNKIKEDWES